MVKGPEFETGLGCVHCESSMEQAYLAKRLKRADGSMGQSKEFGKLIRRHASLVKRLRLDCEHVGMIDLGAGGHEPPHEADDDLRLLQCPKCATFWFRIYRPAYYPPGPHPCPDPEPSNTWAGTSYYEPYETAGNRCNSCGQTLPHEPPAESCSPELSEYKKLSPAKFKELQALACKQALGRA